MSIVYITEENNEEYKAVPCKHCKRKKITSYPKIVIIDDLYYAQCPHCTNSDPYDFLGVSTKAAVNVWNSYMGKAGQ